MTWPIFGLPNVLLRGDGFQTSGVSAGSRDDPNPFFKALFAKLYLNQVVISPHVYGPGVTSASTNYFGAELWSRLSGSFGYLTQAGYTFNGVTKKFAIAIGETGSKFVNAGDLKVRGHHLRKALSVSFRFLPALWPLCH